MAKHLVLELAPLISGVRQAKFVSTPMLALKKRSLGTLWIS
jgi:hypothetical protein